ncbi:hypothetical protein BH09BAC5_BH09BAC5_29820 [soil metagenome]
METTERKKRKIFADGPIAPAMIADSIAKHSTKTTIGGHDIFLGQVRADVMDGKNVVAIEYTTDEELADKVMYEIREAVFSKYNLTCLHVHHSLGRVNAGELCLFVFASSPHRTDAIEGCRFVVEEIKAKLPVWGKEIFVDNSYTWKQNTPA